MIKAKAVYFSYGERYILEDTNFSISPNTIVGLIGPNGAGKSTLFKLLRGEETESAGKIEIIGKISHVPQEIKTDPRLDKAKSLREYIDPNSKKQDYELESLLRNLELDIPLTRQPKNTQENKAQIEGWLAKGDHRRAPAGNEDVGRGRSETGPQDISLTEGNPRQDPQSESLVQDSNLKNLSGGQKTRLALARALIAQPDILLLDEPTNFLDTKGTKWVMNFLATYPKTLVVISHDLKLLDKVIDKVLFLNPDTHKIEEYKGNYTEFQKKKEEKDALLTRQVKQQQQHIKRMEKGYEKIQNRKSEKGVRQKIQLKRRIEKMKADLPEMPKDAARIRLQLPTPSPVGELPLKLKNISKSYNTPVLENVTFYIERGERIALLGPNGAGKSTLIKIIMGITSPDKGEVHLDSRTKVGYYSQEFDALDYNKSPYEIVDNATDWDESRIRPFLAKFLFQGNKTIRPIKTLSGGEKTRLSIALLVIKDFNLLILDEPTTYLDPLSQRVILESLKECQGSMLIVSHTKEFIKELAPNRVLFLPENKIQFYTDDILNRVGEV